MHFFSILCNTMKLVSVYFTIFCMCFSQTSTFCRAQNGRGRSTGLESTENVAMASFEDVAHSVRQIFFSNGKYNLRMERSPYYSDKNRDEIVHMVTMAFLETEGIRLNKNSPRASKNLQHTLLSSSKASFRFKQTSFLATSSAEHMRAQDPLGLDSAAKWVKTAEDGLGKNLSPKASPRSPTKHLPILNLAGCYDTIKGFIKTPCQSTAKADVRIIMKRFVSGGRGVGVSGGEHGAPSKKIVGLTSALSECIFGNVCAGKSFQ